MSTSSGPRRAGVAFLQVLLAMLFLAIIGGTVGYLVGEQHNHKVANAADGGGGSGGGTPGGGASTGGTGGTASPTLGGGTRCPQHTRTLAGTDLVQLFYLETTQGSQVWICRSADGTLYYQGHRDNGNADFIEGTNALFLTDVHQEGDGYVARNYNPKDGSTTEYHVTKQRLVIVYVNYASPRAPSTEPAAEP